MFNSRSIKNKIDTLKFVLQTKNYDLIFITETWLDDRTTDPFILEDTPYTIIRQDRKSKKGGGVIAIISNTFPFTQIKTPNNKFFDIICFDLMSPYTIMKHRFILVYFPPTQSNDHHISLTETLISLTQISYGFSILGDFNFPNVKWSKNEFLKQPRIEHPFLDFIIESELHQIVSFPSRQSNFLDLIFTNNDQIYSSLSPVEPFQSKAHSSDHIGIEAYFKFPKSYVIKQKQKDFKNANYLVINTLLKSINWVNFFSDCTDVDSIFHKFQTFILCIIDQYVPEKFLHSPTPKMPQHIRSMIVYRRRLLKNYSSPTVRQKFAQVSEKIDLEIQKFLRNRENRILNKPQTTYQFFSNIFKSKRQQIPTLLNKENEPCFSSQSKSDILSEQFLSVYAPEKEALNTSKPTTLSSQSIFIDTSNIFRIIHDFKNKTNCSPDGIPEIFYKNCIHTLVNPLYYIFSYSSMSSRIPKIWKESIVCPIPKKGNSSNPADYRPISLLCPISKIMEGIVFNTLHSHVVSLWALPDEQHGFRKGRSVTSQLLETFNDFTSHLENKKCVDAIYFDFAKAFDTVPHDKLIKKLEEIGISGSLLNWLTDYLNDRTFKVKVQNSFSDSKPINSGVPQGSVLGPLLFIIYISDLPHLCNTNHVTLKLYADDLKAYSTTDHANELQNFINKLVEYAEIKGLKLASEKCKVLHIGSKNPKIEYHLKDTKIEAVKEGESIRDLGVHFTSDLKWKTHIDIVTSKANRVCFSILRSLKTNNPDLLLYLYKTYALPILEFASPVFNPFLKQDIEKIEKVQRTYIKIIYARSHPHLQIPSYEELLNIYKMDSLRIRRLRADLTILHKIIFGLVRAKHKNTFTFQQTRTRGEEYKITVPAIQNQIRHNSFFIKTPRLYSQLPYEYRKQSPVNFIKLLELINLDQYLLRPTPNL